MEKGISRNKLLKLAKERGVPVHRGNNVPKPRKRKNMKISAIKHIKCPMCRKQIEAWELVFHCEEEIRERTMKQFEKTLLKLCKGVKPVDMGSEDDE